jgi:alpha/beta superfamily hydrolase
LRGRPGGLEALLDEPAAPGAIGADGRVSVGHPDGLRAAVVLRHPHTGYGGTMHTKMVYQSAKALSRIGCAVLRFTSAAPVRAPEASTDGPGEMDDFRAALDFMHAQYPDAPLWAAGMSFGAYIALTVGARGSARVDAHRHRAAALALRLRRGRAEHQAEILRPGASSTKSAR